MWLWWYRLLLRLQRWRGPTPEQRKQIDQLEARAKRLAELEKIVGREFFAPGGEPSWNDIRAGARRKLLEPFTDEADRTRVRKIWEKPDDRQH